VAGDLPRPSVARAGLSLNLLITSTVWRQDHNGFTHQDPASSTS
jgi:phosphoketolase